MRRKTSSEPTAADLAAIEGEWPLIDAEMALVDAEIRVLLAGPRGPSELDWRRLRRAERAVLRAVAQVTGRGRVDIDRAA